MTVAASNWRRADSFLGDSYAYRAYYRDAARSGSAQQFALGQRSRRPGLYISRRVEADGHLLGVFVVKVDFSSLEREWQETATNAFVTDGRGIILISSNPQWQFQTTRPLSGVERSRARRALDFGAVPLVQNALYAAGEVAPRSRATPKFAYVEANENVGAGWRMHVLESTEQPLGSAVTFSRLAVAILALVVAGAVLLWSAFPPLNLWPLAWVAPVFWVWLVQREQLPGSRLYWTLYLVGLLHWLAVIHWVRLPHWSAYFGYHDL